MSPTPRDLHRNPPPRRWTPDDLAELRALNRDFDGDISEVALAIAEHPAEVDRALWQLAGGTPPAAAAQRLKLQARL